MKNDFQLTMDEFLQNIEFERSEKNSNQWIVENDLICEFEMFVATLANHEMEDRTLSDFLFLLTGMERIPPFGLEKKIDVKFDPEEDFADISTCALRLNINPKDVGGILRKCVLYGGGLGKV